MAYTTIDDPTIYFNTLTYTGDIQDSDGSGHTQSITGLGFQPDFSWVKNRSNANGHIFQDSVRKTASNYNWFNTAATHAENTVNENGAIKSFDSDGITLEAGTYGSSKAVNVAGNGSNYCAWNWKAGGTAPAITYTVKVVSDSGNKYRFDDFGTSAVTLDLQEGGTYTFDQSDSSNSGHPLRFSTTSNGTHGGGSEYTTGVTTTGTPGSSGAKTVITVAASAPTLYYYCTQHSGMGGQANTNSTHGSSNFNGSIQSTVSVNQTAGFSIVSYASGQSGAFSIGHGLSSAPKMAIGKSRTSNHNWGFYYTVNGTNTNFMTLESTDAQGNNNADPDANGVASGGGGYTGVYGVLNSSTLSIAQTAYANNGTSAIAYFFEEKKGYSKFGTYTGNGNADGTFIFLGFKPAWIMLKETSGTSDWSMYDNKREPFNLADSTLEANTSDAEATVSGRPIDMLSNGFKLRGNSSFTNESSATYIYLAFAENPFVNSNGIPTNAR